MKTAMKQFLLSLIMVTVLISCGNDDDNNPNNNNPNLVPPIVNLSLNLNLPQYSALNFPGSTVVLPSQGIRGIVLYNKDNTSYFAFDMADPNHFPKDCSRMELNGIVATCPCSDDNNSYGLALFGLHETDQEAFPMLSYRIQRSGNTVVVTN